MHITPEYFVGLPRVKQIKSIKYSIREIDRSIEDIVIRAVGDALGIEREELISKLRTKRLSEARCIAISIILSERPEYVLKRLGKVFNRDHSTIIYSRELYKDLYGRDKQFTYKANLVLKGLEL